MTVSIVVPVLNEQDNLQPFFTVLQEIAGKLDADMEFIFVNDGSTDGSLHILERMHEAHPCVHYVDFSRNFGKEAAILAGLERSTGEFVAVMDADLQDPPELLLEMHTLVASGAYDMVGSRRISRTGESWLRSFCAKAFYWLIRRISRTQMIDGVRDFRLMSRPVVESVLELREYNRFSKGLFSWVGYRVKYLEFENRKRIGGRSSWSFGGLAKYSVDGIMNFSNVPLQLASYLGFLLSFLSIIGIGIVLYRTIVFGDPVAGWPSLVSIMLLIGGLQLYGLGILGQYIGRIYLECKKRPHFIVRKAE
ncbi:MAG: glycosyltransferase family 2 protein [Bifidobacterium sp.]|uniref:Glycosyltransferase family 2 protein n=1 Tax=Bifidobacterium fermentum TaxID=3059035 RepID=A0AB39UFK0_9BIFI